jgi:hypothetical protein
MREFNAGCALRLPCEVLLVAHLVHVQAKAERGTRFKFCCEEQAERVGEVVLDNVTAIHDVDWIGVAVDASAQVGEWQLPASAQETMHVLSGIEMTDIRFPFIQFAEDAARRKTGKLYEIAPPNEKDD